MTLTFLLIGKTGEVGRSQLIQAIHQTQDRFRILASLTGFANIRLGLSCGRLDGLDLLLHGDLLVE